MSWTVGDIRSHPLISFCAGGVGGVCLVLTGHPFDTIKVRIQTAPKPRPGEVPIFTGSLDCFKKTVSKEVGTRKNYSRFLLLCHVSLF